MKINPVLKNESMLAVRTWKFPLMILVYTLILVGSGLLLLKMTTDGATVSGLKLNSPIIIYLSLAFAQAVLLLFMVPSMTSTVISSEREKQTLEVLLSTKMSSFSIIIGKLFAPVSKVIILIFLTLPVYGICFLIGGINLKNIVQLALFFIVVTFFVGAIGIFFSTILKSSKASTAATYGAVVLVFIGIIIVGAVVYVGKLKAAKEGVIVEMPGFIALSPFVGFISLLINQVGASNLVNGPLMAIKPIINMSSINNMVYISIAIQVAVTIILITLSSMRLNPIKKPKNKKITS